MTQILGGRLDSLGSHMDDDFPLKADFGTMRRKRNGMRVEQRNLMRISKVNHWRTNVWWVNECGNFCKPENAVRLKKLWRSQGSHRIKKVCNRRFRRLNNLKMIVSPQKHMHRKATEFWWEYY